MTAEAFPSLAGATAVPPVSLVICTRNRASKLAVCLAHLSRLEGPQGTEVVLVDNGSTDGTLELLQAFVAPAGMTALVVREPDPGSGRARNSGWRASTGRLVAFTDDDCYVTPGMLTSLQRLFDANPRVGCIGGRVELHDPADLPMSIIVRDEPARLSPGSFARAGFIIGANMALRRTVLEEVGGFDPVLGAGTPFACEDIDVVAAVLEQGWEVLYHPEPTVRHHHGRRREEERVALTRVYDAGRGAYYAKHLLQSRFRRAYAAAWLRSMRQLPLARTAVEVGAAARYLVARRG